MRWVRTTAVVALATGVLLTACLALALAALVFRLYSQVPQDIPPVLPGLILSLALGAGSFLYLGGRLRAGRKVRAAAYQGALGLVILSLLVLARQAARLFGAEWPGTGSTLLGMGGLVMGASGTLTSRRAREALVEAQTAEAPEDLRAEVETLVAEIQQGYRQIPAPPPPLTTWELVREGFLRPARAFRELKARPHLELCWIVPLGVLLWPRLSTLARPGEAIGVRVLGAIDYALWIALYDLGKAALFWGIARLAGRRLGFAAALVAFMVIDFPSFTTYIIWNLWPGQYIVAGTIIYNRLGLGPFVAHLAATNPALFDILAKLDLNHVWTFLLWWIAIAVLMDVRPWVALLLTMVTFPGAHIFAFLAEVALYFVSWGGDASPFFGG